MKLRPYQNECVNRVMQELLTNNSTICILPTGAGKTVIFSEIIRRFKHKDMAEFPDFAPGLSLVLCHRIELIQQSCDKIARVTGLKCEIEMGDQRVFHTDLFGKCDVVVSTIQTQTAGGDGGGRMAKFDPEHFSLVICDEAHKSVSPSWKRALKYYKQNPNVKIVGFTATPDRSDEEALGQVYDTVAYDYEIVDAINDGWLVDIEQRLINVGGLDFSGVRTTAGDLNGADLASLMEAEKNLHGIAGPSIEIIGNKRALAFTASVKQAEMLCEIFNRHRTGMAAWVCGETDKVERKQINADFAAGKIQVLCNCGTHTEGFDDDGVDYIIMAKPTKSRSLYAQMAGRSTRPHGSIAHQLNDCPDAAGRKALIAASVKPRCFVIDFVGNAGKHKLMTTADILGGNVSPEVLERAVTSLKKSGDSRRMVDVIAEVEEEIKREREERRRREEARKMRLVAKAAYSSTAVNPFDVFDLKPTENKGWDKGKYLTEGQSNILRKQGIDPDKMPFGQARQILNEVFNRFRDGRCSYKQAIHLKKHGYSGNESREEASKILDALWGKKK